MLSAAQISDVKADAFGVALARSAHIGLIQRLRLARWISLWARGRLLAGHSPLVAGGGWGTWFLPGVFLPVGHNTWIAELNFYFRL